MSSGPCTLTRLDATELVALMRAGTLSVEALAIDCLDRIAARDPFVHAWTYVDREAVIEQARALDRRAVKGVLHGLPVGVKDVILTRDMPTQYNSPIYEGHSPGMDASCVATLREAGALILGKTDTVEFAATGRPAATRNPHGLKHTPGGSSSGSAAAVADGHVPVSLGTQTGGSMLRPASFCGVFAIKPTWGSVCRDGVKSFSPTLDTVGWFGRSARDLQLIHDVFDTDPLSHDVAHAADFTLAGARVALCRTPVWERAEAATRGAMATAAADLRAAGAEVFDLELPPSFAALNVMQDIVMRCEGGVAFLAEYRRAADQLHPSLRDQVERAAGYTRAQLLGAYDIAARCRAEFDQLADSHDFVLTPSTVGEAPCGLAATGDLAFNAMWTLLHVPCINVPGFTADNGLPVGLTVTGPRFSDRRMLAVAARLGVLFARHGGMRT